MAHRIVVPFELPDATPISRLLIEDLAGMEVVLLGHYNLPEQTPPDAARTQFEEEAQAELDALAQDFIEADIDVTKRLIFGKDRDKAIDQVAIEEDCDSELDPAPTDGIERILVPMLDTSNIDRMCYFVSLLCEDTTNEVTLFHVVEPGEDRAEVEAMLESGREQMIGDSFDPGLVDIAITEAEEHDAEILRMAEDYDAVVMSEVDPSVSGRIFGTLADKIANRTGDPVIIVRKEADQ
jgi:nucleotide-binding universal stress UspA family protein